MHKRKHLCSYSGVRPKYVFSVKQPMLSETAGFCVSTLFDIIFYALHFTRLVSNPVRGQYCGLLGS